MYTAVERIGRVGFFLSEKTASKDYRVHIPLLTHTLCSCQLNRQEWVKEWNLSVEGIIDAMKIVDKDFIKKMKKSFENDCLDECGSRCWTCFKGTKYIIEYLKADRNSDYNLTKNNACMHPFFMTVFISEFGQNKKWYTEDDLPDLKTVLLYMQLYGRFDLRSKGYDVVLYPWAIENMKSATLGIINNYMNESLGCNTELLSKAINDRNHQRWIQLRKLFEQLLAIVKDKKFNFRDLNQKLFYESALSKWQTEVKNEFKIKNGFAYKDADFVPNFDPYVGPLGISKDL